MRKFMKICLWGTTVGLAFFTGRYVEWKDWHENVAIPMKRFHEDLLKKYPFLRED